MSYSAQTFTLGEQPTTSKWNLLWGNDASFHDGSGIAGLSKNLLTTDSNPYKFRARRAVAQNTTAGTWSRVNLDTIDHDSNNNFDATTNHRYTIPVTGYYQINGYVNVATSPAGTLLPAVYKNGTSFQRGTQISNQNAACGVSYSDLIPCTAGDYLELWVFCSTVVALDVAQVDSNYMSGFLVSRT